MDDVVECAVVAVLIAAYLALLGWLLGGAVGLRIACLVAAVFVHLALPTARETGGTGTGLDRR